jgi:hypothetical protein
MNGSPVRSQLSWRLCCRLFCAFTSVVLVACAEVDSPDPMELLPADYKSTFVEVSPCQSSLAHNAPYGVLRATPAIAAAFSAGAFPFPVGTLVVQEQFADSRCVDPTGYVVMKKESAGFDSAHGDWRWARLDRFQIARENGKVARCIACHVTCGARDFTCTEPSR